MPPKNQNKDAFSNLDKDTPILDSIGNRNPFEVPDGYFDEFQNDLFSKIKLSNPKQNPFDNIFESIVNKFFKPQFAIAASLIAIFSVASVLTFNKLNSPTENLISNENKQSYEVKFNSVLGSSQIPIVSTEIIDNNQEKTIIINYREDINIESLKQFYLNNLALLPDNIERKIEKKFITLEIEDKLAQHKSTKIIESNKENIIKEPFSQPNLNQNIFYSSNQNINNNSNIQINNASSSNLTNPNYQNLIIASKDSNSISNNSRLIPTFILPDQICKENSFILKPDIVSEKYLYEWSTGENTAEITIKESGIYTLKLISKENPKIYSISQTEVRIIPTPQKTLPSTAILCSNKNLTLKPDIENPELYTYFWLPTNQTEANITIRNPGMYVLATTACYTYFDTVMVFKQHCDVIFPNIITPNNDGINDYFTISGLENHPNTTLTIFDRNRKIVFSSNDYNNKWDGDMLPEGTYFYIAIFKDGLEKHGSLTIIR